MGMFFLRHKTKLADTGFFRDFVDSHSHILPGVDDGIRTIEESLTVLAYFESLGVKKVRLTPQDRKSTRLNSSHVALSRMPSSA